MKLRVGYRLRYEVARPTPMVLMLNIHFSRVSDMSMPDHIVCRPSVPITGYRDGFGNWCSRIVAPAGSLQLSAETVVNDTGDPDPVLPDARQTAVEDLPEETLVYLLGSRFCDSDRLGEMAWSLFSRSRPGWERVQAVCDFVHGRIVFGYEHASATRTASEAYREGVGVCRDYAHLAVAFCRALNIPARYCTGYLSDIGTPPPHPAGDFAAWFEAYLDGRWYTFDPRNNVPRIGRVLIARGRDAADVALTTTFGPNTLTGFEVWTDEVP